MADLDADRLLAWIDDYERLWRTPGVAGLRDLFAEQASYLQSPVEVPRVGLDAIAAMWEAQRDGADEVFTMTREVVAVTGDTGVARVLVRYGQPLRQEYVDLWVVRFDSSRRAVHFEEWPYWPRKTFAAGRAAPVVVDAASVQTDRYAEWVRSGSLSSGVYRLAAGAADGQSPHEQDEVYVVTRGTASLQIEGAASPVRPGSVAYVPARAQHRFVDISDDLELVVVFAPPESEGSG